MADLAKKQLRKKVPELQLALERCLLLQHRFLLADMLEELDHIGSKIARVEQAIEEQMHPYQKAVDAWMTVPGVKQRLAWNLVAEVGPTVDAFPSAADLVSWAGICPGNNETAGKRKSGTTRNGNRWARQALCEAAWAASKTKATYLQAPVSTIGGDSWQQTRHHCSGEHDPDYRLPYAEGRNHVPRTGRRLLRQTQHPANYQTTGTHASIRTLNGPLNIEALKTPPKLNELQSRFCNSQGQI